MLLSLTNLESDADRINELTALERLIASASARRAQVSAQFRVSQLAAQRAQGVHKSRLGKGIADQIALARRISPHAASHHIALATAIAQDLPLTMQLWSRGQSASGPRQVSRSKSSAWTAQTAERSIDSSWTI